MKIKDILILFSFFLLVTIFRSSSFFQSVIDQDETAYLLGANSLLKGETLYTEIWDNKPPIIFILFSLGLLIFGNSVFSIRIIANLAVVITCFFLYKTGKIISNDQKIGLLAGLFYAILTLTNGGLAANTEIFFNAFTSASFFLLFKVIYSKNKVINKHKFYLLISGILISLGIQIKQVVLFEFLAMLSIVTIYLLYTNISNFNFKKFIQDLFQWYFWLIIGVMIPTVIIFVYFFLFQDFPAYFEVNFTATLTRVAYEKFSIMSLIYALFLQIKTNSILWIGLLLTPVYIYSERKNPFSSHLTIIYLLTWSIFSFLGICAIKSFFTHYFIELQLPLCLLISYIIINSLGKIQGIDKIKKLVILGFILIPQLGFYLYLPMNNTIKYLYFRYVKNEPYWGDSPAVVASYLKDRITDDDYIYVFNYEIILYYLTKAKIPTKYVHISLLTKDRSTVAGINPEEELSKIIEKNPKYIIKLKGRNNVLSNQLNLYLSQYYLLDKEFTFLDQNEDSYTIELYVLNINNSAK